MTVCAMATRRKNKEDVGLQGVGHAKGFQARAYVNVSTVVNVSRAGNTMTTLIAPLCRKAVTLRSVGFASKTSRICGRSAIASGCVPAKIA